MDKKAEITGLISEQAILPLYFNKDADVSLNILKSLYKAGIRLVEYTNRGEAAFENIKKMRALIDSDLQGMYLGVGTIKDGATAQKFIDAGVDFIISPGLVESVAEVADKNNMLWIPGCMTPSEIIKAESLGAKMIKLFPGNLLGPAFLQGIKELFPDLLFMPTGGVDMSEENLKGWFGAGVCAVGMGSKLITKTVMENKQYDELEATTRKAIELIRACKNK